MYDGEAVLTEVKVLIYLYTCLIRSFNKALLIQSAVKMDRYSLTAFDGSTFLYSVKLGYPPDSYQGFGQVQLSNLLPLQDGSGLPKSKMLFVYDNLALVLGKIAAFTLNLGPTLVGSTRNLKVTLVWTDLLPVLTQY